MEIITDSLLIQEYQNGNELALERLIERNQSDLLTLFFTRC